MSESEKSISEVAAGPLGRAGEGGEVAANAPQRRIGHWVALILFVISGIALAPWIGGASETNPARQADVPQAGVEEIAASNSAPPEQAATYAALVASGASAVLSSAPDHGAMPADNAEGIINSIVQTAADLGGGMGGGRFSASGGGGSAARGSGGGLPSAAGFPSAMKPAGAGGGGRSRSFGSDSPAGSTSETPSDTPTEGHPDSAPPVTLAALPETTEPESRKEADPATPPTDSKLPPEGDGSLPPEGEFPTGRTGPGDPASPPTFAPASTDPAIAAVPTPGTALLILLAFPLLLFFHRRIAPQRH